MKVVIKKPNEALKVIDVEDLKEINKLLGNIDEDGNGISTTGSDYRQGIFEGIDMYVNKNAIFNADLQDNFWDVSGRNLYCGNVVFAGYNSENTKNCGACSLTDEQIDYLIKNINSKFDI